MKAYAYSKTGPAEEVFQIQEVHLPEPGPGEICVRVQWTGPWTAPNANPRWAYRHTHWIATYMVERQAAMLFDCNGGIRGFKSWEAEIVPLLTDYDRADGGWYPTHVWKLT